jgi:glycosyltransferase involved in cell wall biosynthesis
VAGSDIGALPELIPSRWLSAPGDANALAATIAALQADPGAGEHALATARELLDPTALAAALASVYTGETSG